MSKTTTIGFTAFGVFVFVLSVLLMFSPALLFLGMILASTGGVIFLHGMRSFAFHAGTPPLSDNGEV